MTSCKTTVWHISSNRWNSAISEYALNSIQALGAQDVGGVFTPLSGSPAEKRAVKKGITTKPLSSFGLRQIRIFRELYREIKPNKIVCYGGPETFLASLIASESCKLVRFRGTPWGDDGLLRKLRVRLAHGGFNKIIVPCDYIYTQSLKIFPPSLVAKVPLGVGQLIEESIFEASDWLFNPTLLMVARFDPIKGHKRILQIFAEISKTWSYKKPLKLLLVGRNENLTRQNLLDWSKELDLADNVEIIDSYVDNVGKLMQKSTLGIVPSQGSEWITRVSHEFLRAGTPIFVSDVGGLKDSLFRGAGAAFSLDDSVSNIADKLKNHLENSMNETAQVRKERALKASNHFSLEKMGELLKIHILEKG